MKNIAFACFAICVAIAFESRLAPAVAAEPKWPNGPYKYIVVDQEIGDVLTEFGRNLRIPVQISGKIEGRLRGRLPIVPAREFLDRLCESYGLVWYFDGATLHVSSESEMRTHVIELGNVSPDDLLRNLGKLAITDPRYAIRATEEGRVISVSGPPAYIEIVRKTHESMARALLPTRAREIPGQDIPGVKVYRGGS